MSHESRFRGILMIVQCHDADGLSPEELYEVARICVNRFTIDQLRDFEAAVHKLLAGRIAVRIEQSEREALRAP